MKKKFMLILAVLLAFVSLTFTGCGKEEIVIYTSSEDYTMEFLQESLEKEIPDCKIVVEYMSTSNIAAKIIQEGENSDCDIIFAEQYGYIDKMAQAGVLTDISSMYDYSVFTDDSINVPAKNYLLPAIKTGGGIIINNKVLTAKGLQKPTCYADLLDEKYNDLIVMPSPKSSGTGYMFFLSLINEMGEEAALKYFDDLNKNILEWSTSGSTPVNKLTMNETAVGLGMIGQAAEKINQGFSNLEILFFEEGAPYEFYGNCIVKGKEQRENVKKAMDYLYNTFTDASCARYYPEPVLKDKTYEVANFPKNIEYSDMSNNTLERKEELLKKWKY